MIGRITTLMTQQMTLSEINQALDRLDSTQEELSSGKKINQPSDDPYGTGLTLQLNGELSALTSYSNNATDGTAWTTAATSSLSNIDNMVQRAQELVISAANGSNSQTDLDADAQEVNQVIDAIKEDANAQYNGQYIFSGLATGTAPYQTGAVDTYQGGSGAINREIGPGVSVQVNTDISQLLGSGQSANGGSGDGLLLDTLRTVAQHMQSGNTTALAGSDLTNLQTNFNSLTEMEANMGAMTDRLQLASSRIQDLQTSDTQVLSNTQDADMAQTEINFSTEQAALQAALQAGADIVQSSLMNFLSTSSG
jgi:flagellar hook-associated protein 3 FlgL